MSISSATVERRNLVKAVHRRATTERFPRGRYIVGPLVFSVPFLLLAFLPDQHFFTSSEHSHAVVDALLARRDGSLDQLGRNASPLLATFAYIFTWLSALKALAAVAAGFATWIAWRQLSEVPLHPGLRALLLASFGTTPALMFLGNAQASEMITLVLLLVAWRLYLRFVVQGITWNGFAAGLVLAIAFFSDFTSIAYVIPFAVAAPATLFRQTEVSPDDKLRAAVTGFLVIALPAIFALVGWSYVNWIINGNPLAFSSDGRALQLSAGDTGASLLIGYHSAVSAFAGDMLRVPIYPIVALLLVTRSRRTLAAYLFPFALTTVMRLAGFVHSEAFTLSTYVGFALVGVVTTIARWPQTLRRGFSERTSRYAVTILLIVAGVAQITANVRYPLRTTEAIVWRHSVLDGANDANQQSTTEISRYLHNLPDHSVLADDNAYPIIAQGRTVKPYVLPSDARFDLARSDPSGWVEHILVNTNTSAYDHLSQDFSGDINGFFVDHEWPGWRLLTRNGLPSVSATDS